MNSVEEYNRSLSFWKMGFYFLDISNAVFNQTIKLENAWIVIDDKPIDEKKYNEKTEFSDFNLIVPTLFNLYHGFELVFKGFLLLRMGIDSNHDIERLYEDFKKEYSDQNDIFLILDKYILKQFMLEPLKTFFNVNNISAKQFYEALRYPVKKNFTDKYEYIELQYKSKEGLPFFKETVENISKLKFLFVQLGRKYEVE